MRSRKPFARHANRAAHNLSGLAGDITRTWSTRDKLRIDLAARHELASWWQTTSALTAV
jgi:hypothetical protein